MNEEEKTHINSFKFYDRDELEDLTKEYYLKNKQLQNKIKELEDRLEVQTIYGYPIEEAIQILSALTIERVYDIKFTMDNLNKFVNLYQKEQTEMLKDTLKKIDVEWPSGGKEITIRKVDAEALEDYR